MLYNEVLKFIPTISLATVYRILNRYAREKTISSVHVPDSPTRYDDWTDPHHHLLCENCGCLFDLPPMRLQEMVMPQTTVSGHTITGVELIFRGICSECAANKA